MNVRVSYLIVFAAVLSVSQAFADPTILYYDTNGATGGTSTSSTQNFTDSVWTTDPNGLTATTGYTPGSDIVFSANDGVNVGTGTQSVTVQDTESADGFTFNNGIVTLFGSGSPNLSIGAGGITVNSAINGATTFDSSLGTLTLTASQEWSNNSSQALNVNSNVTASGSTLSFGGTGSGNVNLSGQLTGTLNLTQSSATSTLDLLNGNNNFTGTITASGGTIAFATPGSFGGGGNTIELDHGGTLFFTNDGFSVGALGNNVVLGTGGGTFASGVDDLTNDVVTGGTGLTISSGDFIPESNAASNVGTLNVTGGRLLAFGDGIFGNNAIVNVSSGATLDFGQSDTLNNTINLANGSALENRSGGIVLSDVILPTGNATVTLGADDVGGGSITLNGPATNLANGTTLTLDINENHANSPGNADTTVILNQAITGSGALTLTLLPGYYNEGTLALYGNNSYSGPTTITGLTVYPGSNGFGTSTVTTNSANIELTGGNLANHFIANSGNTAFNMANNSAQTISGPIELSSGSAAVYVTNGGSGSLTLGNITYDSVGGNYVSINQYGPTGSITLNGVYTTPSGSSETMSFGGNGDGSANYYLGPNADFTNFQTTNYGGGSTISLNAGNLYIDTSAFDASEFIAVVNNAGTNHSIDIVGSQDIPAYLYTQEKYGPAPIGQWTMAQTTADSSIWSGYVLQNDTSLIVSAVDGGRLTFTNDIGGSGPAGVIKTGAGVVVFANPNGTDYGTYNGDPGTTSGITTAPFSIDIQQGTLLIKNSQGYGVGNNNGSVNVEKGATFGGSGFTAPGQTVIAEDKTSVISPGDAGQANLNIAPTIGILNITGSLTTASNTDPTNDGVTLDFKLNGYGGSTDPANDPGVNNDEIVVNNLTLNGTVTINLTAIGSAPLLTGDGNFYILMAGSGAWSGDPTFVINAPTGYALDNTFGQDDGLGDGYDLGYKFSTVGDTLAVQLIAVPEPSTYALMGLGLLALVAIRRARKLHA